MIIAIIILVLHVVFWTIAFIYGPKKWKENLDIIAWAAGVPLAVLIILIIDLLA